MGIVRVVFERGLEVRLNQGRWTLSSTPRASAIDYATLSDVEAAVSPLRMVLATQEGSHDGSHTLLLRPKAKASFDLGVSHLTNRLPSRTYFFAINDLRFLVGAVGYHCQQLAEIYAKTAIQYVRITEIPGRTGTHDGGLFGGNEEAYYEFDALVTAARRSYDSCRYVLWPRFGRNAGSTPRSLESLLQMPDQLPAKLYQLLATSWRNTGALLTQYRDCIHHYVPVDFGGGSATMHRHSSQAWCTMIRIPDNPEARSKAKFTFALGRDALTYGWEVAEELLAVAMEVVDSVEPSEADA